ncbi:hypothetical protein [Rhodococcus opacus]|uniref:Uncharacterized protein n=1 Tax=Rhodococcus opacus TaxID=37919 RepID=A0A076F0F5_RHOOP|nr:hypothetical protein [Rhodococcus opacus]AII11148.1 hypothetical protein EP51_44665 [Rhodococcus opacus]
MSRISVRWRTVSLACRPADEQPKPVAARVATGQLDQQPGVADLGNRSHIAFRQPLQLRAPYSAFGVAVFFGQEQEQIPVRSE